MTVQEKRALLDDYRAVDSLFNDLVDLSVDALDFRPQDDYWTIREHVVHCLDVEISNFSRYRKGIVNPGAEIMSMDESWTEKLNYGSLPVPLVLDTIRSVRRLTHAHLSTLVEDDWTGYSFFYDKYGLLDFEGLVPAMVNHMRFHRDLIDRNLTEFEQSQAS